MRSHHDEILTAKVFVNSKMMRASDDDDDCLPTCKAMSESFCARDNYNDDDDDDDANRDEILRGMNERTNILCARWKRTIGSNVNWMIFWTREREMMM